MLLSPVLIAEYQNSPNQWGQIQQTCHVSGDNLVSLLGVSGVKLSGVFFERNTAAIILEPVIRFRDFGLAEVTTGGIGALWKSVKDPSTKKRALVQYSGVENVTWSATSIASLIGEDRGFAVSLYLGAPPNGTTDLDASGVYRQVSWPSNSIAGENRYRVTLSYEEQPYVERSTDAGATWERLGELGGDLSELKKARNNRITLSVLVIDGEMVVWLSDDLTRPAFLYNENAGYKAGTVKIEGKGGYTSIGFADIRHKKQGHYVSHRHFGPADMTTPTPEFYIYGTTAADLTAAGQTMTGAKENTYPATYEFDYRLSMTSPALAASGPDAWLADTTPFAKQVTIVWPMIYTAPSVEGWTPFDLHQYWEKSSFDPVARVLRRMNKFTIRAYGSERNPASGVEAIRISMHYKHKLDGGTPLVQRGVFIGNTEARFFSMGRDAFTEYDGHDLMWFLEAKFLPFRLFPSRWCVYSLVRLLLDVGGIVPELQATLKSFIQTGNTNGTVCGFGPDPDGCNHTKMPAHPGWGEMASILSCLEECKEVEFAWMGEDEAGQLRFEPFDPETYTTITKAFTEAGTAGGAEYDEIGYPGYPWLTRNRSVSGVKNVIRFAGVDQGTGLLIGATYKDTASITDPDAPNYTGGERCYSQASSFFVDQAFLDASLDKVSKWARLPFESTSFAANGQPELVARQVITVKETRVLGDYAVPYLITDHELTFTAPGTLVSVIQGVWTGNGSAPGHAPTP